jgi:hypothetical protein
VQVQVQVLVLVLAAAASHHRLAWVPVLLFF